MCTSYNHFFFVLCYLFTRGHCTLHLSVIKLAFGQFDEQNGATHAAEYIRIIRCQSFFINIKRRTMAMMSDTTAICAEYEPYIASGDRRAMHTEISPNNVSLLLLLLSTK